MKLNLLILAAVAAAALFLSWVLSQSAPSGSPVGAPADKPQAFAGMALPDFSAPVPAGGTMRIADLRGRYVILNFWATWCLPCVEELPRLLEAASLYPDDVSLVLLSADRDAAVLPRFFRRLDPQARARLDLPNVIVAHDPGQAVAQDLFQTVRLPETILADRDLVMRDKFAGSDWTLDDLRARLRAIGVPEN